MLHVDSQGQGPDLVMLHGWGMHSAVWDEWADVLAARFRVHRVDLPGHGHSQHRVAPTLDAWSEAVLDCVPGGAWWLGWSLGGLVALQAAYRASAAMKGLLLVASTPRFVAGTDWPGAVQPEVFSQFAAALTQAPERTLMRFLALQVRNADGASEALRALRGALGARPIATPGALAQGLDLLQNSDLRHTLDTLELPCHWLLGGRDTLVPAATLAGLAGRRHTVPGAGHAPFLSHQGDCTQSVLAWTGMDREARHASA